MKKDQTTPQTVIGIDLGDKKHAVCVMNQAGKILRETSIPNNAASLKRLGGEFPAALAVIEVGTHSPWISRLLKDCGLTVLVANPRKVKAIYANTRKSDRLDAVILARLGRLDPELLHPIEHNSEQAQRDLLPVKMRDTLVRQRTASIASLRGSMKSLGVRLPSCSSASFPKQARAMLVAEGRPDLLSIAEPILLSIESLRTQIVAYEKIIEETAAARYPEAARLREIPGVGPITSLSFVLMIENADRFSDSRDVGAWLGLVPRRDQSGDSDKQMPISKAGNHYLRRLLVQSAQYILGHFGPDCDLKRYGQRIAARGGKAAKKRAVVALARKLSVLMLALWKQDGAYEPFRGGIPAA
jgi:transposase